MLLTACCACYLQVLLREPHTMPNSDITLWFMVFGGGYQAAFYKPCSDFSLRIRLDIRCSVSPCTHTFGAWEVETMPSHRCMVDTSVLPNGKVIVIGGTEEGLSNLDHRPNSCNVPHNEPWIYDPDAPAGRRYRRTGAYTNIARMYHGACHWLSVVWVWCVPLKQCAGVLSPRRRAFLCMCSSSRGISHSFVQKQTAAVAAVAAVAAGYIVNMCPCRCIRRRQPPHDKPRGHSGGRLNHR